MKCVRCQEREADPHGALCDPCLNYRPLTLMQILGIFTAVFLVVFSLVWLVERAYTHP